MNIVFFTEAGIDIGFGHLIRCKALAQVLSGRGHNIHFYLAGHGVPRTIIDGFMTEIEWRDNCGELIDIVGGADVVVVDSYLMTLQTAKVISKNTGLVLWFDDIGRLKYPGGVILNPAWDSERLYSSENRNCYLLCGPSYQQFRNSFLAVPAFSVQARIRRIMIALGGTLQTELRNHLIHIINDINAEITCLEPFECLESTKSGNQFLDDSEMRQAMESVDFVVTAGGQTLVECIRTGVPAMAIEIVANQRTNIEGWEGCGAILNAGKPESTNFVEKFQELLYSAMDIEKRLELSTKAACQLDGSGGERVADFLENYV